jgi:ribosomal protein L7Ae-like RNA K-turn-binding protein
MKRGINLLGLAQKAGKVVSGHYGCQKALAKNSVSLLLLAGDAAAATKKHFIYLAEQREVPYLIWLSKEQFGMILGRAPRGVVAILDRHFAVELELLILGKGYN